MSNKIRVIVKEIPLSKLNNGIIDEEFDPLKNSGKYDLVNTKTHLKDDKIIVTLIYKSLS